MHERVVADSWKCPPPGPRWPHPRVANRRLLMCPLRLDYGALGKRSDGRETGVLRLRAGSPVQKRHSFSLSEPRLPEEFDGHTLPPGPIVPGAVAPNVEPVGNLLVV